MSKMDEPDLEPKWAEPPQQYERHKAPPGECAYCDRERELKNDFHPSHDASRNCKSGRRSHCSCDLCF